MRHRPPPGDDYGDLAEGVLRGGVDGDGVLDGPLAQFTVRLGTWDSMIDALLTKLVVEAGTLQRALFSLGLPSMELVCAWAQGTSRSAGC